MAHSKEKQGWLVKVHRVSGEVWEFRNHVQRPDGTIRMSKEVVGTLAEYPTKDAMWNSEEMLKIRLRQKTHTGAGMKMLMSELVERYKANRLVEGKRAHSSISRMTCYIDKHILPRWGDYLIYDIETQEVQDWIDSMTSMAPATKAKACQIIGNMYRYAISQNWFGKKDAYNPITGQQRGAGVIRSNLAQKKPTPFEAAQLFKLHQALPIRERAMVSVAMGVALRRSEMQGLQWQDVDFAKLEISVCRSVIDGKQWTCKTEASQRVEPMAEQTASDLLAWFKQSLFKQPQDYVFAGESADKPLWLSRVFQHHIRPVANQLGIKAKGWHTFRHTFGTLAKATGADMKVIQKLLGHSSAAITDKIYVHAIPADKREAQSKVVKAIMDSGKSELIQ
jgi:integrase